ncbi:hypothetical protein, partial [Streptomyces albogriseolus]|uniref:hypothetical protein n=1 Tax=Streptomyces albogriseolus TaxID=1887 RepID=UPI001676F9F3
MATLTGLSLLPGLLTPVVFAADEPDPLGAPKLEAPRSAKVTPFTAKVNKKTAAIVNEAAQADRTAAKRARRDQQHTATWPTAGRATLDLATRATARTEAGDLPVTATAPAKGTKARSLTVEVLD